MLVRGPRKTQYVGCVPSLAPSAISISDLEFPSCDRNARSPHSTWTRVISLKASESELPNSFSSTHGRTSFNRYNRPAPT